MKKNKMKWNLINKINKIKKVKIDKLYNIYRNYKKKEIIMMLNKKLKIIINNWIILFI